MMSKILQALRVCHGAGSDIRDRVAARVRDPDRGRSREVEDDDRGRDLRVGGVDLEGQGHDQGRDHARVAPKDPD